MALDGGTLYKQNTDNLKFNASGGLKTDIPRSASGEALITAINPIVQLQFPYNINTRLVTTNLTGSGTVTQSGGLALVGTGTTTGSTAKMQSNTPVKYNPGQGVIWKGSNFFTTTASNNTIQEHGMGDDDDGFFVGIYSGGLAVNCRRGTVNSITVQDDFNLDKLDGTGFSGMNIDITKGNDFEIKFQYAFGNAFFCVTDPKDGSLFCFHIVKFANLNTFPFVNNPTFPCRAFVDNADTTEDLIISIGTMAGFTEGINAEDGPINFAADLASAVTTTLTPILSIRNKTTYQTVANKVAIKLLDAGIINVGAKECLAEFVLNGTLGGGTAFADVDTDTSVIEKDVASTTISDGIEFLPFLVRKDDSKEFDLVDEDIKLNPGDTLTLAARTDAASTTIDVDISWRELF